jgi:hypothetical protein
VRTIVPRGAATLLLALTGAPAAAQVSFPVAFDGSAVVLDSSERMQLVAHLQEAGRRWSRTLRVDGPRSIEIQVVVSDTVARASGSSLASAFVSSDGSRDTYEQGAAYELRTGADANGRNPDVRITISPSYLRQELWFDPDPSTRMAPVPKTRTDAMSVLLHELGHALAYNGWADGTGQAPPAYWSTFDRWMIAGVPTLFDGPAALAHLGSRPDLTGGNVHHWANPEARPMKAATPHGLTRWSQGRPVPHPACDGMPSVPASGDTLKGTLPAGLLYELMNGVVFYRGARYDISALDRAALRDAGLPVDPDPIFAGGFER